MYLCCSLQSVVDPKSHPVSLPFLNVLAFAPSFIPKLWKWIALNLRVPLEAPLDATRGWRIESVQSGYGSLDPHHACALGLFCQVGSHHLWRNGYSSFTKMNHISPAFLDILSAQLGGVCCTSGTDLTAVNYFCD